MLLLGVGTDVTALMGMTVIAECTKCFVSVYTPMLLLGMGTDVTPPMGMTVVPW